MKARLVKAFILTCSVFLHFSCQNKNSPNKQTFINTANGPMAPSELGFTLTHEHIMSNYGKSIEVSSIYKETDLYRQTIPYLKHLKSLGVNSIFDCTTEYFGRRVDLLKNISDSTGIQIITNTGIYGAANDKHIPQFAFKKDANSISRIWIDEFNNGINGTGIKPGFIKLGFDDGVPSEIDKKLFEAGILTHLETGLTLAVHTVNNIQAVNFQLELLKKYDIDPSAWIWVHADKCTDDNMLINTAGKGAWISFDGINKMNYLDYVMRIKKFQSKSLLNRVLLSHDGNGFPSGGDIRDFDAIMKHLIPTLLSNGFTPDDIDQLMVKNPERAFGKK